jgi:hypothetical protein
VPSSPAIPEASAETMGTKGFKAADLGSGT